MQGTHPPLTDYWARSKTVQHSNHIEERCCWGCWEYGELLQHSHSHQPSWVPWAAAVGSQQFLAVGCRRQGQVVGSHLRADSRNPGGLVHWVAPPGLDIQDRNWRQVVRTAAPVVEGSMAAVVHLRRSQLGAGHLGNTVVARMDLGRRTLARLLVDLGHN